MKQFLQEILKKKNNTWNIRCLVDEPFVLANQQIILSYCRLSWCTNCSRSMLTTQYKTKNNQQRPLFKNFCLKLHVHRHSESLEWEKEETSQPNKAMEICCVRQAPINFPFKFVFNRDLVSHAIYITDLNTKYYIY